MPGIGGHYGEVGLKKMQCQVGESVRIKGNPKQEPGSINSEHQVQMECGSKW